MSAEQMDSTIRRRDRGAGAQIGPSPRFDGGRILGHQGSPRRQLGWLILVLIAVALLVGQFAHQETVAFMASTCEPWEALVQVQVWSEQSAEWDAHGQIVKATTRYACVHTDQLGLVRS